MKRKRAGKRPKAEAKAFSETSQPMPEPAVSNGPMVTATSSEPVVITDFDINGIPPLEHLEQEALQEPNRRILWDCAPTIRILRDKGFSYREIAEWLSERGIEADYNAVYRVYSKWNGGGDEAEDHPLDD